MALLGVQELEEQARMLRGALTALSAREEALRTARTLDDDLGRLRARAESLQASGHPKAVRHSWCVAWMGNRVELLDQVP